MGEEAATRVAKEDGEAAARVANDGRAFIRGDRRPPVDSRGGLCNRSEGRREASAARASGAVAALAGGVVAAVAAGGGGGGGCDVFDTFNAAAAGGGGKGRTTFEGLACNNFYYIQGFLKDLFSFIVHVTIF